MNEYKESSHSLMRRIESDTDLLLETGWSTGDIISYYVKEYGLGDIIHMKGERTFERNSTSIVAAINTLDTPEAAFYSLTDYYFEHHIKTIYPFDMGWGAAVIISDSNTSPSIAKKTKTGNYKDDIKAYIGRYVSFWSHHTPASLLLNNNPVFSNTLMLQISLYVITVIASGRPVRLFPDMYYCLCNPGKRI